MSQKTTDSEIEDVIKDWFRFAKDREEGRKRREQESRQRMEPSVYSNYLIPLFSSPAITLRPSSICPSIRLFQKSSPLKPLNHLLQNIVQMITRVCRFKFVIFFLRIVK
jgi:hypothetical protein